MEKFIFSGHETFHCRNYWLKKGYEEWQKGKLMVFLIPSRTDTKWWHQWVMEATEIRFIKGRLKFGDGKNIVSTYVKS